MRNQLITLAQAQRTLMKNLAFLAAIMAMFLSVSAQPAKTVVTDLKTMAPAPPPPPELFGTGFYMGLDMGANVWQNDEVTEILPTMRETLLPSPGSEVGSTAGSKQATSLAPGSLRPTIEGDFFYNGWQRSGTSTFRAFDGTVTTSDFSGNINTGAFMSNFIARFAFGRFQPYVGAGVGIFMRPVPVSPLIHLAGPSIPAGTELILIWRGTLLPARITTSLRR